MGIKLNLSAQEIKDAQGNFEALPAGTYEAVIYDAKFGQSKSSNNPMYTLTFKLLGAHAKNRQIRGYFVLTAKGLFKLIELNKAVGFDYPKKDTPAGEFEFPDAEEYIGLKVNLVLDKEPYESVDDDNNNITAFRNNVKRVNAHDEDKLSDPEDLEAGDDAGSNSTGGLFL